MTNAICHQVDAQSPYVKGGSTKNASQATEAAFVLGILRIGKFLEEFPLVWIKITRQGDV